MKPKQLSGLVSVAEARFRHEQGKIAALVSEEQAVRGAINAIREAGANQPVQSPGALQLTGADVAWQAWSGQRIARLNIELAQVLSRKEREMAQVRKAFGQMEALRLIAANQKAKAK